MDIGHLIAIGMQEMGVDSSHIPPANFLKINKLSYYTCGVGTSIGTTYYPPGVSFNGSLTLLGKTVTAIGNFSKGQVEFYGAIEGFEAGPITIHGAQGQDAIIAFSFGPSQQSLSINGFVELFDVDSVSIYLNAQLSPTTKFLFNSSCTFDVVFQVQLFAELVGSITDFQGIAMGDVDFIVSAEVSQTLMLHLEEAIKQQLNVTISHSMLLFFCFSIFLFY